jgi:FkbM family methyltransferase
MSTLSSPVTRPTHHAAVLAQPPVTVWSPAGVVVDFLGSKTRLSYEAGFPGQSGRALTAEVVTPAYPLFDEEYFEWIDILESAAAAKDRFVMIELGAGYGRWAVRAALAAARRSSCVFQCVAVEAEPVHFRWMLDHFRDNGLNPDDHDVIWAAVGAQAGFVPFWIGEPDGWYGQAIASKAREPLPPARLRRRLKARSVLGRPPITPPTEKSLLWVPCVTLAELLAPYPKVDLIDLDVQGSEFDVLAPAIELLNERVHRIHIGTHGADIEESLRELFSAAGWTKLNDYPCQSRVPTPYGDITFGDGVQTWLNPFQLSGRSSRLQMRPISVQPLPAEPTADPVSAELTASPLVHPESSELIASLQARVTNLKERNRQFKADVARLRQEQRALRAQEPSKPAESPTDVASLHSRVADLKERNAQLKAETVRLREKYRGTRADGQSKPAMSGWKRLVPGWLVRLWRRPG